MFAAACWLKVRVHLKVGFLRTPGSRLKSYKVKLQGGTVPFLPSCMRTDFLKISALKKGHWKEMVSPLRWNALIFASQKEEEKDVVSVLSAAQGDSLGWREEMENLQNF